MPQPMYVVETTEDFSDESLARKCCDLYERGYFVLRIIEKDADSGMGYNVIAYRRVERK